MQRSMKMGVSRGKGPPIGGGTPWHALPSRQLWVGRDQDGALRLYPSQPDWDGWQFVPSQPEQTAAVLPEDWFPELEAGFCQAFVRQGPRFDKRIKES